jgi:superoxide dismutase, Cu-Zn family
MRILKAMVVVGALAVASAAHSAAGDKATAQMKDRDGKLVGTISLTETPQGVLLNGELDGLPTGPHGFHLHTVGRCEPPFTSAGGHFNPDNRKHGFHDAGGAHAGDLPNLHVVADGKAVADAMAPGLTVSGGSRSLLDQDGTALVIHARADDYRTDPAGESGDRIVCGILTKGQ